MGKISHDMKQQILKDKQAGATSRDLAQKYGLHRSTISRIKEDAEPTESVTLPTIDDRLNEFYPPAQSTAEAPRLPTAEQDAVLESFFAGLDKQTKKVHQPLEISMPPPINTAETIQKILLNADTFPTLFPFATEKDFASSLSSKSPRELQNILTQMEHTRTISSLSMQMKQMFFVTTRATEVLTQQLLRMKTGGLTDALLQQQQELDFIFREIAIKHADRFKGTSEPEMRLITLFGITLLQTDATNRLRERLPKVPEQTAEKFANL